jgi:hypothetical protein
MTAKHVLATLAAGAAVAAVAAGTASSAPPPSQLRMTLVERQVAEHFVDTGRHGLSAGDRNIVRSQILDRRGKVVGRGDIDCVITGVGRALGGVCHGVMTLPGGQVVGEFAFDRSGSRTEQAIVGGSGRYARMSGEAVVDTAGSDEHEAFTLVLRRG